jgi:Ca-activated chloride channel homolog
MPQEKQKSSTNVSHFMTVRAVIPVLIFISFTSATSFSQATPKPQAPVTPSTLYVPVDEISLWFHASDRNGKPLTRLSITDLKLSDNRKTESHIVMLQPMQNLPIHAGFLFDISASVLRDVGFDRSVIQMYASSLLRKGVDQAFVMQFDTETLLTQNWTGQDAAMASGAAAIGRRRNRYDPLTAIFDSLYTTCRDMWLPRLETTGNFILLFTDGEDDASHAYLSEAVDMCQRKHVAIYIFDNSRSSHGSDGYRTMSDLARQTGGRVFIHPRREEILSDLQIMEAEQRNQYLLVYKPSDFRSDGAFHRIGLQCSIPAARITTRSGYYAFPHP